jgi:hypothetical protein
MIMAAINAWVGITPMMKSAISTTLAWRPFVSFHMVDVVNMWNAFCTAKNFAIRIIFELLMP